MSMIEKQINELVKIRYRICESQYMQEVVALPFRNKCKNAINDAISTIQSLSAKLAAANMERSTVYCNGGWIPVEKRLPEKAGWYQYTCFKSDIWREPIVRDLYYYDTLNEFVDNIRYSEHGCKDIKKYFWTEYVMAWMPLPEPYRKEV